MRINCYNVETVLILKNCQLVTLDKVVKDAFLEIIDRKITKISLHPLKGDREIDLKGNIVFPGFVDTHTHGGYGYSWDDFSTKKLDDFSLNLASEGVTSFFISCVADKLSKLENFLKFVDNYLKKSSPGARLIGVHLEGPFIDQEKRGAHPLKFILPWDRLLLDWLLKKKRIPNIIVTYHPSSEDSPLLKSSYSGNLIASLGHSSLGFKSAVAEFKKGTKRITHFYNAVSGFSHRRPGIVLAGLVYPFVVELIVDGIHVDPEVVKFTYELKGPKKIILVTDSVFVKGLPDGKYFFANQEVLKENGKIISLRDGCLAGSILRFDEAVRNMAKITNCSLSDLSRITSINPLKMTNWSSRSGYLAEGMNADFLVLDQKLNVLLTFLDGKVIYKKNGTKIKV